MKIVLKRTYDEKQTRSDAFVYNSKGDELFKCVFLELPWLENKKRISCIPEGTYKAIKHKSPKFGDTLWLQDVPGRTEILIHVGNYAASKNPRTGIPDTLGCLLPGARFADIDKDGHLDVVLSKATMDALLGITPYTIDVVIEKG